MPKYGANMNREETKDLLVSAVKGFLQKLAEEGTKYVC
jgi:hypothetical protein